MSREGELECRDAWGGDHASGWGALMNPCYLHQRSPDYTKVRDIGVATAAINRNSRKAWTRALRSGVNTFMLEGYAAEKPQAFCNESSARRLQER